MIIKVGSCVISAQILPRSKFLGEGSPNFWTLVIKRTEIVIEIAKFHGDRPSKLGDLAAKEVKIHQR